jgi:hypothetical protein
VGTTRSAGAPGEFIEAISRVAGGGTVLDPEVVRQLLRASRRADSLSTLTPREKEVLSLMATPLPWRSLLRRHQPGWIPTAGRTGRRVDDGPGLR